MMNAMKLVSAGVKRTVLGTAKRAGLSAGLLAAVLASTGMVQNPARADTLITGAGATFPYPLYSKWFSEYRKVDSKTQINYQSIGSGGGIRQLLDGTVDFGASDAPMTDEQLAKAKGPILHLPMVLGAVVLSYQLPGLQKPLVLSGEAVSALFLGKITRWNDATLQALNPGVKLPDLPVMIVHRSDGSGTTAIFTDYLSKVSAEWKTKVGAGPAVKWPAGLGGKGNEGVTGLIKQSPGSLGYVELVYAETNHLPAATLKNADGKPIEPSVSSVTAAAGAALKSMPADFRVSITAAPGKDAYPLSGFTYLLVPKTLGKEKGAPLVAFLKWALKEGQEFAKPLAYARLPEALAKQVQASVAGIELK